MAELPDPAEDPELFVWCDGCNSFHETYAGEAVDAFDFIEYLRREEAT